MKIQEIKYADILLRNEQNYPYKLALFSEGQSYDYKELNKITNVYASKLIEMGIKKGDHVILWGYNNANWFLNFLSIIKAGAVAVLMNYSIPANDVVDLINLTDSKFILYGRNKAVGNDPDAIVKIHEKTGIPSKNILRIPDNDVY
jgi:non-ribosomal peptide synthetase component E (peptide arylation enzyme)